MGKISTSSYSSPITNRYFYFRAEFNSNRLVLIRESGDKFHCSPEITIAIPGNTRQAGFMVPFFMPVTTGRKLSFECMGLNSWEPPMGDFSNTLYFVQKQSKNLLDGILGNVSPIWVDKIASLLHNLRTSIALMG